MVYSKTLQDLVHKSQQLHVLRLLFHIAKVCLKYRIGQKFGGRKVWRIWRILPNRQTLFTKHLTIQLLLSVL